MTTKIKNTLKIVGVLFIGLFLGWMLFGGSDTPKEVHDHTAEQEAETTWTCSMHPQIRQSEPGQCPTAVQVQRSFALPGQHTPPLQRKQMSLTLCPRQLP